MIVEGIYIPENKKSSLRDVKNYYTHLENECCLQNITYYLNFHQKSFTEGHSKVYWLSVHDPRNFTVTLALYK